MAQYSAEKLAQMMNEAYRRGYQDGISDRPSTPAPVSIPDPHQAEAVADAFSLAVANMMGYDGTRQKPIEEQQMELRRTRS